MFWGRPALVHPQSGVVFAVGFGSIGLVMRLPAKILRQAAPEQASAVIAGNPGQTFDIPEMVTVQIFFGLKTTLEEFARRLNNGWLASCPSSSATTVATATVAVCDSRLAERAARRPITDVLRSSFVMAGHSRSKDGVA